MKIKTVIYKSNVYFLLIVELVIIFGIVQALLYKDNITFIIDAPCVENKIENSIYFDRIFFSLSLENQPNLKESEKGVSFNGVYLKYFDTLLLIGRLNCTPMFVRVEITRRNHHIDSHPKGTGCIYLSSHI